MISSFEHVKLWSIEESRLLPGVKAPTWRYPACTSSDLERVFTSLENDGLLSGFIFQHHCIIEYLNNCHQKNCISNSTLIVHEDSVNKYGLRSIFKDRCWFVLDSIDSICFPLMYLFLLLREHWNSKSYKSSLQARLFGIASLSPLWRKGSSSDDLTSG